MVRTLRRAVIGGSTGAGPARGPARPGPLLVAASLAVAVALSGCASAVGGAGGRDEVEEAPSPGPAVVHVINHNWQDMHVYVLASGQRWSLGMVTSQSARTYELPDGVFAAGRDIAFLADPVGSAVAYRSDRVLLEPGDRAEWRLENRLSHSSLIVF